MKVLVTGAAGTVGVEVVKCLLNLKKCELTILDLKNKRTFNRLKRFKKRANIVYGDVSNRVLMEKLVSEHDVVIHLATILPPLADLKQDIADIVEYQSLENIIRAISYYNPKCHLVYASSTTVYGKTLNHVDVNSKTKVEEFDYYAKMKLKCEKRIVDKLENYTILRLPLVLSSLKGEPFMYNLSFVAPIDTVTDMDAGLAFSGVVSKLNKCNKKIFNISGGEKFIFEPNVLIDRILKNYGITWSYILSNLFVDKNYYSPVASDANDFDSLIKFRQDDIDNYFSRIRNAGKNRYFAKLFTKIYFIIKGRKK